MARHSLIDCHAPGYWGGDPRDRVESEYIADKVISGNLDKILSMGLPYALWREAGVIASGLSVCSCVKNTADQPDIPCNMCYGTGKIPGYFRFGTRNYWMAATDSGWALTNMVLDTNNRPNRLMLDSSAIAGEAISPNLAITVSGKLTQWEAKADAFTRATSGSTVVVEASKDDGANWFALSNLETESPTTQLKFKVTMTRTSTSVKTPMFEIVRTRFGTYTDIANRITTEPVIRVLQTWLNESEYRDKYGTKFEANGNRMWTMPLSYFDTSIADGDMRARIMDDAFIEVKYGGEYGFRYALVNFSYSDQYDRFSRQEFNLRKVTGDPGKNNGEIYYSIF